MNRYMDVFTKLSIHPLFWVLIAVGVITAHFREILILFSIVFIHELGHAFAAAHYRWRIKQIQLLPFGGVAELEEHGNKSLKEELVVIAAGPIQHVWMMGAAYALYEMGMLSSYLYTTFFWSNISLLVFNLLPIWPLDGGKIMFNVFSTKWPFLEAHRRMLLASSAFFFLIALGSLVLNTLNLTMWIMLCFLATSIYLEWKQRKYAFMRFLLDRYYGGKRAIEKINVITVNETMPLYTIFEQFRRGYKHSVVIKGRREQFTLDENELLYAYFTEKRITSSIGELIG
ncbi:M50 family metallopeptidase [Ectobacillus antri]|uniref:M50 family metallopeptidase n=1 Tax=Ectobacillus antri TaxID=2486280 RepID=A0ABT6H3Y0_9BACI|nr:M50 family metallopeptidase [Ectobacillus antri]MDG4655373.1 M50 family metallopeptidase [Ectobacillus antri]MDG5753131.1 M50 family metallopeptidase [Ectobacillus antri]